MKMKSFGYSKNTIKKVKRQATEWKKVFAKKTCVWPISTGEDEQHY